jgi:hypothetical protein
MRRGRWRFDARSYAHAHTDAHSHSHTDAHANQPVPEL